MKNKIWLLVAVLLLAAAALGFQSWWLNQKYSTLAAQYQDNDDALKKLGDDNARLAGALKDANAQIQTLRAENDTQAKEAERDAYKKAMARDDAAVRADWQQFQHDVRARNRERERSADIDL